VTTGDRSECNQFVTTHSGVHRNERNHRALVLTGHDVRVVVQRDLDGTAEQALLKFMDEQVSLSEQIHAQIDEMERRVGTAFASIYEGVKGDPDIIDMNGFDRLQLSNALFNGGSNSAYQIFVPNGDAGNVKYGAVISTILNEVTGKSVDISGKSLAASRQ
jgi:hypothetical protein